MKTYKIIKKNEVKHVFKSNQSLELVKSNPALFFMCDGEFEVEKCGQLTAFKLLKNHVSMLINNRRKYNEFTI